MTGIVFLVFFVCIILAIPLAMSMGFATIVPSLIDPSFSGNLEYVIRAMLKALDTTTILAIPLFMMSGAIMCILQSPADSDAFQSGRCAKHNGRPETMYF